MSLRRASRFALTLSAVLACCAIGTPTLAADAQTTRVSVSSRESEGHGTSYNASISADGRYVAFASDANDLVANDGNGATDIFLRDRSQGTTRLVSVNAGGIEGDRPSIRPSISDDGRYIAFASRARNLVANDTNRRSDIFVRDLLLETTTRVSVSSLGTQGDRHSHLPKLSATGRYVVFHSLATNLVTNDANGVSDVFVHDRLQASTRRVSISSAEVEAHGASRSPSITADGRFVAFESDAPDLVENDSNDSTDAFVRDRQSGVTTRISVSTGGGQATGNSSFPRISASNGRYVAFVSTAPDLVPTDGNGTSDIFVHDREQGITRRMSVDSSEGERSWDSTDPSISANGRYVAFYTAGPLTDDEVFIRFDVFVRDRSSGTTFRVSVTPNGGEANHDSSDPSISADGRFVAFSSDASDLIPNDGNGVTDIFVRGPLD